LQARAAASIDDNAGVSRFKFMVVPRIDALQIVAASDASALSAAQKRFNNLLRQIEKIRRKVADWSSGIDGYRQAHGEVLKPLQDELLAGQRRWVFELDDILGGHRWTKAERETLREVLCQAAGELLDARPEDEPLKALFDKHSDVGFDDGQREHVLAMKQMAEAMTGLDLGGDAGLDSDEDLFERMQQSLLEQAQALDEAHAAKQSKRRASAAQAKREAQAQQATQSVRDIYRKLASALHPDRETDARQRDEKTALMQRVNQAYDANDLLALLELQLQIEQIDASHIANAGEQRLKHYNQVLGEQLAELKIELERIEMQFAIEFGLRPGLTLNPLKLGQLIEQTRKAWRGELIQQQFDLRMLDDIAATRRWLKLYREQWRRMPFGFAPF
jgi:hypothetical protein